MKTIITLFIFICIITVNIYSLDNLVINSSYSSKISKSFFGINTLYWLQDDQTRIDKNLNKNLESLNLNIMRYPGGEIADNFDWKTNTLNDSNAFPYSRSPSDSKVRMDFDEFMGWTKSLGTTASIVVNLENGYIENNISKAAELAAEWVRYANITKDYNIKYWEIGNESNILETRYPLTSLQYAEALKIFSEKMKAVDPTIQIGAVGPVNYNTIANIEVLSQYEINRLLKIKKQGKLFPVRKYIKTLPIKKRKKGLSKQDKQNKIWWNIIAKKAGNHFDFAVVHRYYSHRKQNSQLSLPLNFDKPIKKLRNYLTHITKKDIPISVTEWSFPKDSKLSGIYKDLTMAEMIGDYLKSGALFTEYFPMYKHTKNYRSLFHFNTLAPKRIYSIYKAFSSSHADTLFQIHSSNPMLYTIATFNSKDTTLNVYIINKSTKKVQVETDLPFKMIPLDKAVFDDTNKSFEITKVYHETSSTKQFNTEISPLSLTIIHFQELSPKIYKN